MSAIGNSISTQQVSPLSKLWWVGLVAAAAAALGNALFYFISRALGVSYLMPVQPGSTELDTLPVVMVVVASVVPAIAATILYALLGRFVSRPRTVFWVIAAVALVLSFGMPVAGLGGLVDTGTFIALEVMHVIAAVAIVGVLTILGRAG